MLFATIVCIVVMMGLSYLLNEKRLFSPSMAFLASYFICAVVAACNLGIWKRDISVNTMLLIFFSALIFVLGESFGYSLYGTKKSKDTVSGYRDLSCRYMKNNGILFTAAIFILLAELYLQADYFYRCSVFVGNKNGFFAMFRYGTKIRDYLSNGAYQINPPVHKYFIDSIFSRIIPVISDYFLFIVISKVVYGDFKKKDTAFLIIPAIQLAIIFISTSRIDFIYTVIFAFAAYFCLYFNKNGWHAKDNKKIIRNATITLAALFTVFWFMGFLTGKQKVLSFWGGISAYTGSSLMGFDIWLNKYDGASGNLLDLFTGVKNFLTNLGFTGFKYNPNLEFVKWYKGSTNIYTSMRPYLSTIGVLGNFLAHFAIGTVSGFVFNKLRAGRLSRRGFIVFCMFFYVIVMSCIAERFASTIFTLTTVLQIIVLFAMDTFFFPDDTPFKFIIKIRNK